ncbi:MAG: biotin/lipoyl-binding protein [Polynucleobacter sp.]|nr:MAG: biotin/lipoyl-binding protein [Polynucleobacter sp.]
MHLKHLSKLLACFAVVLGLQACGKDADKEVLPRQVKVAIVGHDFSQANLPQENIKNPESLSFDASGKVMEVLVQKGQVVLAGQPLARLMPNSMSMSESSALTSYRAARAEIQSAEADFKRYADLRQKNFISASEFEKRIAMIEGSRAKFEQTLEQLGFVSLRAVEPGSISQLILQVGQQVPAQQVVVQLKLATKTKAPLTPAFSKDQMIVPSESIHGDGTSVYRVKLNEGSKEQGTLELVKVQVLSVNETYAVIGEGLQRGDLVLAAGWHALNAGQKVRVALIAKAH